MRPIDADELKDLWCSGCNAGDGSTVCREHCIDIQYVDVIPTLKPETPRKYLALNADSNIEGKWIDDTTDVVCSTCKCMFDYEMLIFIAEGKEAESVDGMTCRCPACGSYNRYGGDSDG